MPDHACLDNHPARWGAQRQRQCSGPPSAEPRAGASPSADPRAGASPVAAKALAGQAGLPGGAHDLAGEALRLGRAAAAIPDAAGTDSQLAVVLVHRELAKLLARPTARGALI